MSITVVVELSFLHANQIQLNEAFCRDLSESWRKKCTLRLLTTFLPFSLKCHSLHVSRLNSCHFYFLSPEYWTTNDFDMRESSRGSKATKECDFLRNEVDVKMKDDDSEIRWDGAVRDVMRETLLCVHMRRSQSSDGEFSNIQHSIPSLSTIE